MALPDRMTDPDRRSLYGAAASGIDPPRALARLRRVLIVAAVLGLWVSAGEAWAAPAKGSSAAPETSGQSETTSSAVVQVYDTAVFPLAHAQGGLSPSARARAASEALKRAITIDDTEAVRTEKKGMATVVFAGAVPIVELYDADAQAAHVDSTEVYAASVAARVESVIRAEKKRTAVASTVFSASLVVFFGLIALYVSRKLGEFATRARDFALNHPERIPAIRLQSLELVGPVVLRGGLIAGLVVGRWLAQIGLAYAWLVFALSLFRATRPYTGRLTGFVVDPLSDLAGRIAVSLPLAVVAFVCGVAVYLLLRFIQLFFTSVARGESKLGWLPADLALPTSTLLRIGIVAATLVFAAPVMTGDPEGSLARSGAILLLTLSLASAPLLASGVVGAFVVFGRRLQVGHLVEVAGRSGRILEVGLLEIRLVDESGSEIRVPHLLTLVHPTRALGERPRVAVEIGVSAEHDPSAVRALLLDTAARLGRHGAAELTDIDGDRSCYRVTCEVDVGISPGDLRLALAESLGRGGMKLSSRRQGSR